MYSPYYQYGDKKEVDSLKSSAIGHDSQKLKIRVKDRNLRLRSVFWSG